MGALSKWILLALHILVCLALLSPARGDDSTIAETELEKYEKQVNMILRTRLDEEKAYVHEVIELIRTGRLPRKLVDKSLGWVRNHCRDNDYYFVYFERVLRRQAKPLGFDVPVFDYDVYDTSNR